MATYFIDYVNGNDANSGQSKELPLQHCPSASSGVLLPGDVVIFKGGVTYLGTVYASGGSLNQEIIYDGDSGLYAPRWGTGTDKAKIRSTNNNAFDTSTKSYIKIINLDIASTLDMHNHGILIAYGSSFVTVQSCIVKDCHGFGIAGNTATDVVVKDCILGPNDPSYGDDPVQIGPVSRWTFDGNTFLGGFPAPGYDGHFDDIQFDGAVDDITIKNNIFKEANSSMIISGGQYNQTNIKVYNNIFVVTGEGVGTDAAKWTVAIDIGATHFGGYNEFYIYNNVFLNLFKNDPLYGKAIFVRAAQSPNSKVFCKNNIFYNCAVYVADYWLGADQNTVFDNNCYFNPGGQNNIIWGNETFNTVPFSPTGYTQKESKGIIADPKFFDPGSVNPAIYDVRLQPESPCIDKGATITLFTTAFDGVTRPQGNAWDIGIYEYQAGSTAIPTRELNNIGQGFVGQNGLPLSGIKIQFTLVDIFGNPVSAFDQISHSLVLPHDQTVTTNIKGEFSVNLLCTSSTVCVDTLYWKATVFADEVVDFLGTVPYQPGPARVLKFYDFVKKLA